MGMGMGETSIAIEGESGDQQRPLGSGSSSSSTSYIVQSHVTLADAVTEMPPLSRRWRWEWVVLTDDLLKSITANMICSCVYDLAVSVVVVALTRCRLDQPFSATPTWLQMRCTAGWDPSPNPR